MFKGLYADYSLRLFKSDLLINYLIKIYCVYILTMLFVKYTTIYCSVCSSHIHYIVLQGSELGYRNS